MQQFNCAKTLSVSQEWSLIDHDVSDGIDHMLFKTAGNGVAGKLQYVSKRKDHILATDPPLNCVAELELSEDEVSDAVPWRKRDIGGRVLLHPQEDKMVKDCIKLFERTAQDVCKKKMTITRVLGADMLIVDGLEVDMDLEMTGPAGKTTHHTPSCVFEVPFSEDASLLEKLADPAETDPTREEKIGMTATLRTSTDLCKADEQDGEVALTDVHATGLLSYYKGYEHLETLPRATFAEREDLPQDVDLRTRNPKCFQQGGKEVIRDQGGCGSCWAFAGATAIMNTLCTSREDSPSLYANPTDRLEISIQQLMNCNAGKAGCQGGINSNVHSAALQAGLSKERAQPYRCAAGDSANHMEGKENTCQKYPWGGVGCQNDMVKEWNYGGAFHLKGESQIMSVISQGHSVTVGMNIDWKFTNWGAPSSLTRKEIYDSPGPTNRGGHAMAGIGYGTMGGKKYWLIQNSWGEKWGDVGTIKIIRGINIHGIEDGVFYFRAWVEGATQPPLPECQDSQTIDGITLNGGGKAPCSMIAGHLPYCDHAEFGRRIRLSCPATCNACPKAEAPPTRPPTQAPPTRPPTPPPTVPSTRAPEPAPVPAPPAHGERIVELGRSNKDKKCVKINDELCEVLVPPCKVAFCYDFSMEGDMMDQACVTMSGGWKENVKLKCEGW